MFYLKMHLARFIYGYMASNGRRQKNVHVKNVPVKEER